MCGTAGAGRRRLALGLGLVRIEVPGVDDRDDLQERLAHFRVETRDDGRTLSFADPWLNRIEVSVTEVDVKCSRRVKSRRSASGTFMASKQ